MSYSLPLERMSVAEKLAAMEAIWADLRKKETDIVSPPWHEGVLREREAAVAEGKEKPIEWEEAKRRLRELGP